MQYPIVIHKDPDSDYGVTVPDLPGCFTAGSTMDEALSYAVEAIECHLEGLMIDPEPIPIASSIQHHQANPDYADGIWAFVSVDLSKLSGSSESLNVTLPQKLWKLIDDYAVRRGDSRSGVMGQAALEFIASHS